MARRFPGLSFRADENFDRLRHSFPILGGPDRAVLTSPQQWRAASHTVIEIMRDGGEFAFRKLIRRVFNSDVNTFITFYHSILSGSLFEK